jgi:tetrapyrrole methylase family protein / MazG family protein
MLSPNDITAALVSLEHVQLDGLQLLDAGTVAAQHYPLLDPGQPGLLLGVAGADMARQLAATLMQAYPGDHTVQLIADGERRDLVLAALGSDAEVRGHLFIPPRGRASTYEALQDVVAQLRAPDGCPWDRALTWPKLRASLLEESYELLAALDAGDTGKVLEEQGDLLLQVALQAQIATEEGRYRLPDVIARIVDKLVRRHPHVFGNTVVSGTDEVLANWEAIKAAERAQNSEQKRSPLAGVPAGLPALSQAEAYLDRMSRLRPHVPTASPWEPLAELAPEAELTPELLGEVLFGIVGWALSRGVEAESSLREANERFAAQVAAEEWG